MSKKEDNVVLEAFLAIKRLFGFIEGADNDAIRETMITTAKFGFKEVDNLVPQGLRILTIDNY